VGDRWPSGAATGEPVAQDQYAVDPRTGEPETLCETPGRLYQTWGRDNVFLAGGVHNGIAQLNPQNCKSEPLTELDATKGEVAHVLPYFLPDGNHYLYVARGAAIIGGTSGEGSNEGIYAASLDGKENKLLVREASSMAYAAGHLLFVREGTLMAQPFNPSRLELTGDAFPIAEQVQFDLGFSLAAFSASSNGVLAYHAASGALAWSSGAGGHSYCSLQKSRIGGTDQLLVTNEFGLHAFEFTNVGSSFMQWLL